MMAAQQYLLTTPLPPGAGSWFARGDHHGPETSVRPPHRVAVPRPHIHRRAARGLTRRLGSQLPNTVM